MFLQMGIAAILRVQNEARWIEESIRSLKPLRSRIFVLDDHSTDNTSEIVERLARKNSYAVKLCDSPFEGEDEARDKNFLLGWALKEYSRVSPPEWIICIDGDEVLEDADVVLGAIESNPEAQALSLRISYLWDCPQTVRVDGVYGDFFRSSIFRTRGLTRGFSQGKGPANWHCGNAPHGLKVVQTNAVLKHYGYMLESDRRRKREKYGEAMWPDPGGKPKLEEWRGSRRRVAWD